ncbi:MAG: transposase [Chloroflexi bacterium]|nr:transposase [Chloroflexota bacterium]
MALREGNRQQMEMMPPSIEQYIPDDTPVRVYDAFVEAMDLKDLGIDINPSKEGNPCYDPRAMLKLLVYGYSYGVRSSRKALKKALGQCVNMCMKLDLIAGNVLFVDGSKIRANASIKNTWSVEKCRKVLRKAERRIEEIISESEAIDKEEEGMPSLVSVNKELADAQVLKERISQIMEELRESGKPVVNTVDKECTRTNSVQGTHAGYNAQVVVDDGNGLIVSCDAVGANNDILPDASVGVSQ